MKLTGLHLLLSYQCTFECDHCFVWGSPWQSGTMSIADIRRILSEAQRLGTVDWIYFEGGEPFLYYVPLLQGVRLAARMGFQVGIVTNSYWATTLEDALEWLRPFTGLVGDLSISSDLYHYDEVLSQQARNASRAAEQLDIPLGVISIAQPESRAAQKSSGQIPAGESNVLYRGRAARKLASQAVLRSWDAMTACEDEDLQDPGRLHADPFGNLHICQGIVIGNLYQTPLSEIIEKYHPASHPITSHLLDGGPAALFQYYRLSHEASYADACHMCYQARSELRHRFPHILTPDQMYGVGLS